MTEAKYSRPTSQVDLEHRQSDDYQSPFVKQVGDDAAQSDNGYIGVGLEYQNHANSTEAPVEVTEGPEAKVFDQFLSEDADYSKTDAPAGSEEAESQAEETQSTTTTPPTGTTPPSN